MKLSAFAKQLLSQWPEATASPLAMAKRLGMPINAAYLACQDLERAGMLVRTPEGYVLSEDGHNERKAA